MLSTVAAAALTLLVVGAPGALAAAAPPLGQEGCVGAGGQCLPTGGCPDWQRPVPGLCGTGRDCCFLEYTSHALECGTFGGECTTAASCGGAPRHPNAFCPTAGHVCCVWLY
ncbi:U-scoloptoxin(19)-Tl1a-like isoform X2 [Amphibalanus amphitrite]|uniref:U-scoloptoxin(19)-Tl1a-like isoform X2 n=1 Tax=Amphibalanus amphitrite TaxID=1232801 RepID=UPI001C8FE6E6|nr:U-scoloptoxin(19)-Tl1a-like isoform X2 [Amphibalanus amphitrite]XP_043230820.1 U-scoloptoxin(19)-Tl1a-like isoform X2 [Amphibalanus amphitrite]XP_043230821.1 U-scoloptoxin(19)-Tl1a-like isoform X2 [Amphibalanus amphitrite]XP_043230822.1 U-scoloptoxin(19)-Tl1a-like isoform X2 [Amphibalanus amphitrite]